MGLLQEYQSVEKMHRSKVKQRAERQFKIGPSSFPLARAGEPAG
jgi:t-SNARE complex subunit (syntaxin)